MLLDVRITESSVLVSYPQIVQMVRCCTYSVTEYSILLTGFMRSVVEGA